jgi:hypothetical protein
MQRQTRLKLAIVETCRRNYDVASEANEFLESEEQLTELDITRIITGRMVPSNAQRAAIAKALGYDEDSIFD